MRAASDRGAVLTSIDVSGGADAAVNGGTGNCENDARPPDRLSRRSSYGTSRICAVVFCANTTKPRCSDAFSGLWLPGDPTISPPVMREV